MANEKLDLIGYDPITFESFTRHATKHREPNASSYDDGYVDAVGQIEDWMDANTVDAVPVVHGEWLYYSTTMQECSNCKRHTARHKFKYCPHCGAVMEDKYNDG